MKRSYSPLATWRRSRGLSRSELARIVGFYVGDLAAGIAHIEAGLRSIDTLHPRISESVPPEVIDAHKSWEGEVGA